MISLLSDINIELLFFKVFVTHTKKKTRGKTNKHAFDFLLYYNIKIPFNKSNKVVYSNYISGMEKNEKLLASPPGKRKFCSVLCSSFYLKTCG